MVKMWQVYRHYDIDGELLYIGNTTNLMRRQDEHSRSTSWFNDVVTIKVNHYTTPEAAKYAEVNAIINENPKYNTYAKVMKMLF